MKKRKRGASSLQASPKSPARMTYRAPEGVQIHSSPGMGRTYITVPSSENSSENSPSRSNLMHDDQSDLPPEQKLTVEYTDCGRHVPAGTPQTIRGMLADGGEPVTWTHVENIAQELHKQQTKLFRPVYAHHAACSNKAGERKTDY